LRPLAPSGQRAGRTATIIGNTELGEAEEASSRNSSSAGSRIAGTYGGEIHYDRQRLVSMVDEHVCPEIQAFFSAVG